MTANAPKIRAQAAASSQPAYRPHGTQHIAGDFVSVGDGASSGNYAGGTASDEPIDRTSIGSSVSDGRTVARPFGFVLTSQQRQDGRQWLRRILATQGRSDMSGMY